MMRRDRDLLSFSDMCALVVDEPALSADSYQRLSILAHRIRRRYRGSGNHLSYSLRDALVVYVAMRLGTKGVQGERCRRRIRQAQELFGATDPPDVEPFAVCVTSDRAGYVSTMTDLCRFMAEVPGETVTVVGIPERFAGWSASVVGAML